MTNVCVATSDTQLLFFSVDGMAAKLRTWRLTIGSRRDKGRARVKI